LTAVGGLASVEQADCDQVPVREDLADHLAQVAAQVLGRGPAQATDAKLRHATDTGTAWSRQEWEQFLTKDCS
jgi:photosystem II stability/assembly factor-like uncharacterized protein